MEISTEPTCPGHKRNQDSLNENQAVRLMRTLIYFIFPLYFISVSLDAVNQQVIYWVRTQPNSRPVLWGDPNGGQWWWPCAPSSPAASTSVAEPPGNSLEMQIFSPASAPPPIRTLGMGPALSVC